MRFPLLLLFLTATATALSATNDTPVYSGVIAPILSNHCISCHGEKKQKKNLRLDSLAAIMKGGKDGEVIVPGKTADSDLVKRINLDVDDDDHMPPKQKTQLTPGDIRILEWWIAAGAPGDVPLRSLAVPAAVRQAIQSH